MRLVRLAALFGSLVLLVATSVSLFDTRSELRALQEARAEFVAADAGDAIDATIRRARAVVEVAPPDVSPDALASSFGSGTSACVVADESSCTGADLTGADVFADAARQSAALGGASVAVVDEATASVLVVVRGDGATTVVSLPESQLVGERSANTIADFDGELTVSVRSARSGAGADSERTSEVTSVDGRRVVGAVVADVLDGGEVVLVAGVPGGIALGGEAPLLYGTLLALGTLLLGLAGWTFLVERRTLERRATTDELTGLVNRSEFERLSTEALTIAGRLGTGLCVMLIDLNDFKQINDTRGHQVGDDVLRACARRLRAAVRETDVVGRWGGDEFVILLPGIQDGSAVRKRAERIAAELSATPVVDGVSISGSVGAALYPRHGRSFDELMRRADVAMYAAKTTGVTHRLADPLADDVDVSSREPAATA